MIPGSFNTMMMVQEPVSGLPSGYSGYWTNVSGSTLTDEGGNYDGTIVGASTTTAPDGGDALVYDGANDVVIFDDILNSVFVGASATFTLVMYAKAASNITGGMFNKVGHSGHGENQRQFSVYCRGNGTVGMWFYGNLAGTSTRSVVTSNAIMDNAYHVYFITFDYSAGTGNNGLGAINFYVDDGSAESKSLLTVTGGLNPIVDGAARLAFGAYVGSSGGTYLTDWTGESAALMIYPRVLDSTERSDIYTTLTS